MTAAALSLCGYKETVLNSSYSSNPTNVSATDLGSLMEFHPVAALFRMMNSDELEALRLDIASNGQTEDILLAEHDGVWKIADGRNRYIACMDVGVTPRYRKWNGDGNLTRIVISLNLNRRHLTESERALIAAELANISTAGRPTDNPANLPNISQAVAASMLNVSERSVRSAVKVLKDGDEELIEVFKAGDVSVSFAAETASLSPAEQRRIVHQIKEIKKTGRRSRKNILKKLKTQSLRQTAKGSGTCLYCNPEIEWTDETVSAFAQRVEQRGKEAQKDGRADKNFAAYFETIAIDIEDEKRAASVQHNYEKIFAAIDAGADMDNRDRQCAEKTDIQRITGIPWPEFSDTLSHMLECNMIEAVKQGGKTDGARGARKILFRRAEQQAAELTYEIDEDFPEEDVYYDPWN